MTKSAISTQSQPAPTPMMAQYMRVKESCGDCLLFYRMGDFYELFFDDARIAAKTLDIALTKRGKHEDVEIPMCGVPVHSHESYLARLIRAGHRVAICEQMESPEEAKKRGYKAVVAREIVRIVTPGTLLEENLLPAREPNFLAAIAQHKNHMALAFGDISTGTLQIISCTKENLISALARFSVRELILPDSFLSDVEFFSALRETGVALTPQVDHFFDVVRAERRLKEIWQVETLEIFSLQNAAALSACGALMEYMALTQKNNMPPMQPPKPLAESSYLQIDISTRRSLELTRTNSGEYVGSVLHAIDQTITSAGGRLLQQWISTPLAELQPLQMRLDAVEWAVFSTNLRAEIRNKLRAMPDISRALARLSAKRGSTLDLAMLRDGLRVADEIYATLAQYSLPELLKTSQENSKIPQRILHNLATQLVEEIRQREQEIIAPGVDEELDKARYLRDHGAEEIQKLRERYRDETGIQSLKLLHNNILGYFVEVTQNQATSLQQNINFVHRQTMAGAMRFTSQELRALEAKLQQAQAASMLREQVLFQKLVDEIIAAHAEIYAISETISLFDVIFSCAEQAEKFSYVRPQLNNSTDFFIKSGRHVVIEKNVGSAFVANDCALNSEENLWLITGPNMAGKSTFLRQNALIAILAQIGSFVPAQAATIGILDAVFSRVGAADDLARGRSTFMVEMIETAMILHHATNRSLVILDEVGRGTATYDGLAIACAVVEHLHNNAKARTLFATHYHELTSLAGHLRGLSCHTMRVQEWQNKIVFLHEVIPGSADRSYGIHVAERAGLPKSVIVRAEKLLAILEQQEGSKKNAEALSELPLFADNKFSLPSAESKENPDYSSLVAAVKNLQPDLLSPRESHEILYQLIALLPNEAKK
jgi:DNA mismatch repair protein MutS